MNRFLILIIFILSSCVSNTKKDPTSDLPYKMYKDYKVEVILNRSDSTEFSIIKKHFNRFKLPDFKWEQFDSNSALISFTPVFDSIIIQELFTNNKTLDFLETFDLNQIEENLLHIVPEMATYGNNNFAAKYIKTKKSIEKNKEKNPVTPVVKMFPAISSYMVGVFDKDKKTDVISLIGKIPDFKSVNDSMLLYWHRHPYYPDSLELFSLKKNGLHEISIHSDISKIKFKEKLLLKIFEYDKNDIPTDWRYVSLPHIEIKFNYDGSKTFHNIVQKNPQKELLFSIDNVVVTDYYIASTKFKQNIELSVDNEILKIIIWDLFLKSIDVNYQDVMIRLTQHNNIENKK